MDPIILSALISLGIAIVTVVTNRQIGPLAKPVQAPTLGGSTSPSSRDPFAILPGLPGHPLLNAVLMPWLNRLVTPPTPPPETVSPAHSQAATAALAALLKSDPSTLSQLQASLGASK